MTTEECIAENRKILATLHDNERAERAGRLKLAGLQLRLMRKAQLKMTLKEFGARSGYSFQSICNAESGRRDASKFITIAEQLLARQKQPH